VVGILAAVGLMFGLLALARNWMAGATFGMDASIIWVLVAGVVITVVASWLPASYAMRVSLLEAMRPVSAVSLGCVSGECRLMLGLRALARNWMAGATFGMDASIIWVLVAGVVITVVASWLPASHAMRVSPLEAMRPVPAVTLGSKAGKFRLILGAVLFVAGTTGLVLWALDGQILPAILAGAVSFIGVLALGVLFVPGTVYGLGWLSRSTGIPGKIAQL